MEPLEQVTVLITLMQRLAQVMDQERLILKSLRIDSLPDLQDEKVALAEAYEIELDRIRRDPSIVGALEPQVRERLQEAMRDFQDSVSANLNALVNAQSVIQRILDNIGTTLAQNTSTAYGATGQGMAQGSSAQVISVAFDRKL